MYIYLLYLCMCVHNKTDAFCNCLLPNVINAILTHFSVERKQKSKLITWQQSPFDPPSPLLHNAHVQHTGPSVCVCEWQKQQHIPPARRLNGRCNIFASSTDFRSLFHLPNVRHVLEALLLQLCHSCVAARQLDGARQLAYLACRLTGYQLWQHRLTFWVPQVGPLSQRHSPLAGTHLTDSARCTVYGGRWTGRWLQSHVNCFDIWHSTQLQEACDLCGKCHHETAWPMNYVKIHSKEVQKDCPEMGTI